MKKRIFSLLLLVAMLVTAVPVVQVAAAEEVVETPKSESVEYVDLHTLYVKEGLVSLFTAFGDNTGIDLAKGTWTDRLNGNVATFKAPHRWFRTGENGTGAVAFDAWAGYMKTVDGVATYTADSSGVAFPTENYLVNITGENGAKLDLSKANVPDGDVSIEYLALYRPVLIADADKSTESKVVYYEKDGKLLSAYDHNGNDAIPSGVPVEQPAGDAIGHFYSFTQNIDGGAEWGSSVRGSVVWMVGHRWWYDSGGNYKFVGGGWHASTATHYALAYGTNMNDAFHKTGGTTVNTYGAYVDEEKDGESGVKALFGLYRDGVDFADNAWLNSSETAPYKDGAGNTEYGKSYPLAGTSWTLAKNYWLSADTPTEFYSVRIYDRVLGEDERLRNHVIDVLLYYGIGLTLEQTRDVVFMHRLDVALADVSLETNAAAKEATEAMLATCVSNLDHVMQYAANEDMTALFTVYAKGTVDLENGVWRNLLPGKDATIGNTKYWSMNDDGSFGFNMYYGTMVDGKYETSKIYETDENGNLVLYVKDPETKKDVVSTDGTGTPKVIGYKNTNWNDYGTRLDLGIELLPEDDFTVEYLAQYKPYYVTDGQGHIAVDANGNPIQTYDQAKASNWKETMPTQDPGSNIDRSVIRMGYLNAHTHTYDGSWGGSTGYRGSGTRWTIAGTYRWSYENACTIDPLKGTEYFVENQGVRTYAISRAEVGEENIYGATYTFYKDANLFDTEVYDGTKYTSSSYTKANFSVPEKDTAGNTYPVSNFWLSERYGTDFYTLRIYDRVLNEKERKHNVAMDVMNYYDITLSADITENDALYEKVKDVLANADLVENALAKEAAKSNLLAAIKSCAENYELVNQYASPENLTSLFTVHKKDSLDLAKGTWTDIITGNNATFGTFWEQRENGAFGFDMWAGYMKDGVYTAGKQQLKLDAEGNPVMDDKGAQVKEDIPYQTTHYISNNDPTSSGFALNIGTSHLSTEDFTVEYVALYRPVLVLDTAKSSATETVYYEQNGKLLAAYDIDGNNSIPDVVTWACDVFGWFSTRTMNTDGSSGWNSNPRGTVHWMIGQPVWGSGDNYKFVGGGWAGSSNTINTAKGYHMAGVDAFYTYSVSVDETVTADGATEALLSAYRNGTKQYDNASCINSTANPMIPDPQGRDGYDDYGKGYPTQEGFTGKYGDSGYGAYFYLSAGTPTDFMVVRIYDKALTEEEQKHNLAVDILNYYGITLPTILTSDAALYADALSLIMNTPIVSSNLERSAVAARLQAGLLKIAGVSLKAENDYAALYVTKGANATLKGLYTAFYDDYTANLITGVWENQVENSGYDDATLKGAWKRYDQGIGYRIVAASDTEAKTLIDARGGGVLLDNDYEKLKNFTVETFATVYGVTDAEDNRLKQGTHHPFLNNFRFGLLTSLGWRSTNGNLKNRWAVTPIAHWGSNWTTEQGYTKPGDKYATYIDDTTFYDVNKNVPVPALMTATKATDETNVVYTVGYNNAATNKVTFTVPVEENRRLETYTESGKNFETNRRFSLFNVQAATVYVIRVYEGVLTAAEKAQNRLADLLYYYGVDLPEGFTEDKAAITAVAAQVADMSTSDPAKSASNKQTLETAIASVSKQVTVMDADGTVLTSLRVLTGNDYILPATLEEKSAIAWHVNGDAKAPGSVVAMTEDITVKPVLIDAPTTAHTVSLKTTARADDLAMRFTATIARADFEAIAEIYGIENLRIGMLITPVAYVEHANGVFTREALRQMVLDKTDDSSSPAFVDVEAGSFYAKTDTTLTIAGSIYRFSDVTKAKNPAFTAVAYIDVVTDDVSFTVYGSYDASVQFRVKDTMIATRPYMTDQQRKWINALLELFA